MPRRHLGRTWHNNNHKKGGFHPCDLMEYWWYIDEVPIANAPGRVRDLVSNKSYSGLTLAVQHSSTLAVPQNLFSLNGEDSSIFLAH